jgi:hypothetical protein
MNDRSGDWQSRATVYDSKDVGDLRNGAPAGGHPRLRHLLDEGLLSVHGASAYVEVKGQHRIALNL